jgi:hypothetical protein
VADCRELPAKALGESFFQRHSQSQLGSEPDGSGPALGRRSDLFESRWTLEVSGRGIGQIQPTDLGLESQCPEEQSADPESTASSGGPSTAQVRSHFPFRPGDRVGR